MKKQNKWKENLAEALEIPRDLALKESIFTVTGKSQLQIENYRSILCYEPQEIIVLTFNGKLVIHGKSLKILYYTPEEMQIRGIFREIILEQ
ncbi:MAG: YabP/YqfC family sporulation protein [Eubacteriales bacterium]|nr:YabP/YqfC family sporulation protein [Eubacteriales bacterium]